MTPDLAEIVAELLPQGAPRRYPEGSLIFAEGDNSTDVLLVRSGRVRVVVADDHYVVDLSEGDLLGEFAAVDGAPRSASAHALTEVELTAVGAPALMAGLVARGVDLNEVNAHTSGHRLRTEAKTLAAGGVPVAGVARLLAQRAHNDGSPTTLQPGAIAAALGCSREVVSRALEHLADNGIVALDRGQVVVLDLEALHAYAARPSEPRTAGSCRADLVRFHTARDPRHAQRDLRHRGSHQAVDARHPLGVPSPAACCKSLE